MDKVQGNSTESERVDDNEINSFVRWWWEGWSHRFESKDLLSGVSIKKKAETEARNASSVTTERKIKCSHLMVAVGKVICARVFQIYSSFSSLAETSFMSSEDFPWKPYSDT